MRNSMVKGFWLLILAMPLAGFAQQDAHRQALAKIQIEEGYYAYDMYYPGRDGNLVLGASVKLIEKDSSKLAHCYKSMGGKYLNITLSAQIDYQMTLGYDRFRKKYVLSSLDSGPGLIDIYQGQLDAEGNLSISNLEAGTHYLDQAGRKNFNRLQFLNMEQDSFTLLIENSTDHGKTWRLQAKYVVKKKK